MAMESSGGGSNLIEESSLILIVQSEELHSHNGTTMPLGKISNSELSCQTFKHCFLSSSETPFPSSRLSWELILGEVLPPSSSVPWSLAPSSCRSKSVLPSLVTQGQLPLRRKRETGIMWHGLEIVPTLGQALPFVSPWISSCTWEHI